MLVKVLNLVYSYLIVYLAIQGGFNNLGGQEVSISILGSKVVNILYNQEQWQHKAITTYILNSYSLFLITRLKLLALSILISICNNYTTVDNAYYKACLVKVVEVLVLDPILCMYVGYQLELRLNKLRVFIESLLKVVGM